VLRKKPEGIGLNKWVFELNCSSDIARIRRESRGRGTTGGRTRNADFLDYQCEVCYKSVQRLCVLETVRHDVNVQGSVNEKFTPLGVVEVSLIRIENGSLPHRVGKQQLSECCFEHYLNLSHW
jgi:hypothetical protein